MHNAPCVVEFWYLHMWVALITCCWGIHKAWSQQLMMQTLSLNLCNPEKCWSLWSYLFLFFLGFNSKPILATYLCSVQEDAELGTKCCVLNENKHGALIYLTFLQFKKKKKVAIPDTTTRWCLLNKFGVGRRLCIVSLSYPVFFSVFFSSFICFASGLWLIGILTEAPPSPQSWGGWQQSAVPNWWSPTPPRRTEELQTCINISSDSSVGLLRMFYPNRANVFRESSERQTKDGMDDRADWGRLMQRSPSPPSPSVWSCTAEWPWGQRTSNICNNLFNHVGLLIFLSTNLDSHNVVFFITEASNLLPSCKMLLIYRCWDVLFKIHLMHHVK